MAGECRSPCSMHRARAQSSGCSPWTWGSMLGLCAEGRASLPPTPTASEQPSLSHQPRHAFSGAPNAQRSQLEVDPRRTIGLTAICVDAGYLLREHGVCPSPSGRQSTSPTIEATLGDLQRPAHRAHPVVCLLRLDKCVDHLRGWFSSLTKNHAVGSTGQCNTVGFGCCKDRRCTSGE